MNNPHFWRASGLLLLANAIVVSLGLIRTPLMTWVLPKVEFGMFGVVASWMPFLQLASLSGLDSASYHYVAKGQPWAFLTNLTYRLRWSILGATGFLIGALFWSYRGESLLSWMFVIAGLSFPMTIGLTACAGMLAAQERFTGLFWYRIFESLTDFAGFIPIFMSYIWVSKVITFYSTNQIASAFMLVSVSFLLVRQLRHSGEQRFTPDEQKEMVSYGKHLTVISGIGVLQSRSDAFLVGSMLPLGTMADYSIAVLIQEQIKRIWNIYITLRYPSLVRMPPAQRWQRFLFEGILVWLVYIMLGIAIAIAASWLIPLILPPNYANSMRYIDLLVASVVVGIPGGIAELYFRTHQNEKRLYTMRLISAFFGVLAPALLVLRWGALGAATGRLVASLCFSIVGVAYFIYEIKR